MMTENSQFKGPFLFVNKNAKNLKSRSAQEADAINLHVQGKYASWLRETKNERLRRSAADVARNYTLWTNAVKNDEPSTSDSVVNQSDPKGIAKDERGTTIRRQTNESRPAVGLTAHGSKSPIYKTTMRGGSASQSRENEFQSSPYQLNPHTVLNQGNSDPFSVAAVPITPLTSSLIKIWKDIYLESVWPFEAPSRTPALAIWKRDGQDMITNRARLHGLMAWTMTLQVSSLTETTARSKLSYKALVHKTRCIEILRDEISSAKTKLALIPAMWHLTGSEFYSGNVPGAMVHFNALKAAVDSMGGIQTLPWALQKLIIVADMTLCQVRMKPSLFAVQDWDPGSIFKSELLSLEEAVDLVCTPFLAESLHSEIPSSMRDIFEDFRELLSVYEFANKPGVDALKRTEMLCWAQLRHYALSVNVSNRRIGFTDLEEFDGQDHTLELSVCIALDYFLQLLWHGRYKARTKYVPFHHPKAVENGQLLRDKGFKQLSLWITFILATVEFISSFESRPNCQLFQALVFELELYSWEHVRTILKQFVYQETSLDFYLACLYPE